MDDFGISSLISGENFTLYESEVNLEQQGDGFVMGSNLIIEAILDHLPI